jgi:hypothetical protein
MGQTSRGISGKQSQKGSQPKDLSLSSNEKEILRKIEDYRQKLNAELSNLISQEKEKENERSKQHEKETDEEKKKELENAISLERAQSSQKVMKMNA